MNNERQVYNPVGMCADPKAPSMYLPTMTDAELISYAEQFASTALEKELLNRAKQCKDEIKGPEYCTSCGCPV